MSREGSVSVGLKIAPGLIIVFSAIAYFVYGQSISMAIAVFLLCFFYLLASYLGLIPVAGVFLFYVASRYIIAWVSSLTGLYDSWLLGIVFWVFFVISVIYTLICLYVVWPLLRW